MIEKLAELIWQKLEPRIKEAYDEGYKVGTDDLIRRLAYVYDSCRQTAKADAYAEAGAIDVNEIAEEEFNAIVDDMAEV